MDKRTEQSANATLEQELLHNERIIQHPTFGAVRMKRPTPGQERLINEERRKQYHKDLRDPDILSRDQIERLVTERGMWSLDLSKRIEDLIKRTGEAMGVLDAVGFRGLNEVLDDYFAAIGKIKNEFAEPEEGDDFTEALAAVTEYFNLDNKPLLATRRKITDNAPSTAVDDLVDEAEALRTQIELLKEMLNVRKELNELQEKQARLYVDSIESRADRAEHLAKVYYCTAAAETGAHLWPTFADIYDAEASDVEELMVEFNYFEYGITAEFRETLGKYGFTKRLTDTKDSSGDSPDQPQSNSDGESVVNVPTPSSEATA